MVYPECRDIINHQTASFNFPESTLDDVPVSGEQASLQTKIAAVHGLDGLVYVGILVKPDQRPKNLLARNAHILFKRGQHSRLQQIAITFAPSQHCSAAPARLLDPFCHTVRSPAVN